MNHIKIGDFPTNARIKITYPEKGEPKIDFEYPDNERQIKGLWKSSGVGIPAIILTILTITLIWAFWLVSQPINYPLDCEGTVLTNNVTHETTGVNLFCNNITKYYHFHYGRTDFGSYWTVEGEDSRILTIVVATIVSIILYFFLIRGYGEVLAYLVRKTKWGKEKYPGWNQRIHNKHWEAKFTECSDTLQLELPLFSNIYMDYEAEEEFADYLESVEIKEHDFTYYPTRGFRLRRHKRNQKKGIPNVYLWKAIFKFKQKPTKGFLKVNWT